MGEATYYSKDLEDPESLAAYRIRGVDIRHLREALGQAMVGDVVVVSAGANESVECRVVERTARGERFSVTRRVLVT